jgi:hypothetical protein
MAIWDKSRDELYAAANRVLKADGNSFKREKEAFIWALRTFRCEIQEERFAEWLMPLRSRSRLRGLAA